MMSKVFTSVNRVYDFLKWYTEERYCFATGTIKNVTGGTIDAGAIKPGQPLNLNSTQWETINTSAEAGVDGFFVDPRKHEQLADDAITEEEYKILVRGPALINVSAVPGDNATGAAYVTADLITRARALLIEVLIEGATESEQTT
jgi:hypothetical protein